MILLKEITVVFSEGNPERGQANHTSPFYSHLIAVVYSGGLTVMNWCLYPECIPASGPVFPEAHLTLTKAKHLLKTNKPNVSYESGHGQLSFNSSLNTRLFF